MRTTTVERWLRAIRSLPPLTFVVLAMGMVQCDCPGSPEWRLASARCSTGMTGSYSWDEYGRPSSTVKTQIVGTDIYQDTAEYSYWSDHTPDLATASESYASSNASLDLTRSRTSFTVDGDYHYLEGAEYLTIGGKESLSNRAFFTYTDGRLTLISYHNADREFGRLAIEYDSDGAVVRTLYAPPDGSWSRVIEYFYGDGAPSQTRYYLATARWEGAALLFDGQLKHNLVRLDYTITDSTGSVTRYSEAFTYVYDDRVPKMLPKSMSTPYSSCDYEYALFFMGTHLFGGGNQ